MLVARLALLVLFALLLVTLVGLLALPLVTVVVLFALTLVALGSLWHLCPQHGHIPGGKRLIAELISWFDLVVIQEVNDNPILFMPLPSNSAGVLARLRLMRRGGMFGLDELNVLSKGATLLNIGCGDVVDTQAVPKLFPKGCCEGMCGANR